MCAFPRIQTLADELGTGDRNVKKYLRELTDEGLIEIKRTGRASRYYFLEHPWVLGRNAEETNSSHREVNSNSPETSAEVPSHRRESERELKEENQNTRRLQRRAFSSFDDYSEDELEVIEKYHDIVVAADVRWLSVNQFSEQVRGAIADWLEGFLDMSVDDLEELILSVRDSPHDDNIPSRRTMVRLQRDNSPS